MTKESNESLANRILAEISPGASYTAEEIGEANIEQLDALAEYYGLKKGYNK